MGTERERDDARRAIKRMARKYEADHSGKLRKLKQRLSHSKNTSRNQHRRWGCAVFVFLILAVTGVAIYLVHPVIDQWPPSSDELLRTAREQWERAGKEFERAVDELRERDGETVEDSRQEELPLPATGVISTSPTSIDARTGLEIRVPAGKTHYFVKIRRKADRATVATLFVRAGETGSVQLQPGDYLVAWTFGEAWYGFAELFGSRGRYEVGDTLTITDDAGWQIDMQHSVTGDYPSVPVSEDKFRK